MALSVGEVQKMLDDLETKISVRINGFDMGEGPADQGCDRRALRRYPPAGGQRMNDLVTQFNVILKEAVEEVTR